MPKLFFGAPYVTYFEITGFMPSESEIVDLLRPLDPRKVVFALARMNYHLRLAHGEENFGKVQALLMKIFTDDDL